jgi:ankyrin repeat protein
MRKFFIVFFLILLNTVFVNAQGTTDYRFLEVVDFAGKPVAGATIDLRGACSTGKQMTDEKGALERFPIGGGDCGSLNDFTISKDGYFSFRDIGLFSAPHNDVYRERFVYNRSENRDKYKIELLKIPINKAERKAVGDEEKKRELFWAVRDKDSGAVRGLLKSGISPRLQTSDLRGVRLTPENLPAVIYSAALGDVETIKEFLKAGLKLDAKDSPARDILLYYLAANPRNYFTDYAARTEKEKTDLAGFQDGVDFLIGAGADLSATTQSGKTALMIAAENGDARTIKTLLGKGLTINQTDNQGETALLYATNYNYPSTPNKIEVAELLLKNGANPNVIIFGNSDDSNDTYCASPLINAVANQNLSLVRLLLDNRADINLACKNGKTAFRVSLRRSWDRTGADNEIVNVLIRAGADVNSADSLGRTNLMFAAGAGSLPAVELLLKNGAKINARDKIGATVLMNVSYYRGETEILKMLLERGADPNIAAAVQIGSGVVADCETPLMRAAVISQSGQGIELLVKYGAQVNFACSNGETALTRAVVNAQAENVRKLIEVGADVRGEQGHKALEYARKPALYEWRKETFQEIIKILEAAGAK